MIYFVCCTLDACISVFAVLFNFCIDLLKILVRWQQVAISHVRLHVCMAHCGNGDFERFVN